jgi:hypothetical protein
MQGQTKLLEEIKGRINRERSEKIGQDPRFGELEAEYKKNVSALQEVILIL